MNSTHKPHLCFVGPMLGQHSGYVPSQAERLSAFLGTIGYKVSLVSTQIGRYRRFADIVSTLVRNGHSIDVQMLQVFAGPSFLVEDVASWIGRRTDQRIVMILRGGSLPTFLARYPRWGRRVLSRADAIVAPSPYLARTMESHGLRATVIPNVIDIEAYPYHQRSELRPHLLWMRTFHPIYNPEMAVRVLARLQRVIPEATLVMAGQEKGQQAAVQRLACELGVGDTIRFPGFLGMDDKFRAGTAADIFLNTNRVDNMPVSVIEACAMGLPVVATSVGGVPDLLTDGETGLLVPDDDDAMMAARVIELLRNPVLASRLSANGRQLAERSSWNSVKGQWEQLLCNLQVSPKSKGGVR